MTVDKWGHVAYACLFLGQTLISYKLAVGWALYLVGNALWIWLGWKLKMSSIVVWDIVMTLNAMRAWWMWS